MNYIKEVELKNEDGTYNIIIEIPKGSKKKAELVDGTFDVLEIVRKSLKRYTFDYGCFPQTLAGDRDPVDVFLISKKKHKALDVVVVQPVAVIKTIDNGEEDNKIIAVEGTFENLDKVYNKLLQFIKTYKGKKADMQVDETIYDVEEAVKCLKKAAKAFKEKESGATYCTEGLKVA